MATIEKAVEIAARAHAGVRDKQGHPYLLHPIRVMMGVEGEPTQIVAVLHDVIEDTDFTIEDLRAEGFADEVLEALKLVTHASGQSYAEYVIACRQNELARRVKLSDLRDNGSLNRVLFRPHQLSRDAKRLHRYLLSYRFLSDEISEADYRNAMDNVDPQD